MSDKNPWAVDGRKVHPSQMIMSLKGQDYLEVKYRMAWLVADQETGNIGEFRLLTDMVQHELIKPDSSAKKLDALVVMSAELTIFDKDNPEKVILMTSGHGHEFRSTFVDYVEKAETAAIGRALAAAGYGTLQAGEEFDEGEKPSPIDGKVGQAVVDAPVRRKAPAKSPASGTAPSKSPASKPKRSAFGGKNKDSEKGPPAMVPIQPEESDSDPDPFDPAELDSPKSDSASTLDQEDPDKHARREEIVDWVRTENRKGNSLPMEMMEEAISAHQQEQGLAPGKVKLPDLPDALVLETYDAILEVLSSSG